MSRAALLAAALLLGCSAESCTSDTREPLDASGPSVAPAPTPRPSPPPTPRTPNQPGHRASPDAPLPPRFGLGDDVLPPGRDLGDLDPEVVDELRSGYPVDRINGVRKLAPAGTEMELAIDLLDADPDAEVRAAAAEKVGQGVSYGATTGLVRALGDPDPRVVLAALQSLQFRGDPTLVPEIEPLLEHRDDRVRAAAANAIELLRWR